MLQLAWSRSPSWLQKLSYDSELWEFISPLIHVSTLFIQWALSQHTKIRLNRTLALIIKMIQSAVYWFKFGNAEKQRFGQQWPLDDISSQSLYVAHRKRCFSNLSTAKIVRKPLNINPSPTCIWQFPFSRMVLDEDLSLRLQLKQRKTYHRGQHVFLLVFLAQKKNFKFQVATEWGRSILLFHGKRNRTGSNIKFSCNAHSRRGIINVFLNWYKGVDMKVKNCGSRIIRA